MCSNFRVSGLSFDGHFTPEVGLPTVGLVHGAADLRRPERAVASLALAELRLQIAARSTGLVMAWVRKWVVDNCVGTGQALSLNVELLDAAPKQVLARFQPTGCEWRACDEALLGGTAERSGGTTLRFALQQLGSQGGLQVGV